MHTQVGIIGGGPSGLLLSQLLHKQGISNVVLERQSQEYVLSRVRAGLLEQGAVKLLHEAGVGENLETEGILHDGVKVVFQGRTCLINFKELTGENMTIYGQTEVTRDLYAARIAAGHTTFHSVDDVSLHNLEGKNPSISFKHEGAVKTLSCDFIAGCDGYHGVSRQAIPANEKTEYATSYPFGWLGVLSDTPPVSNEVLYAYHDRGFALCSMRSETRSRYYIQVPIDDSPDNWSDDEFWDELRRRLPKDVANRLVTGPSIEKSIAPLRNFVCEPMRWNSLFLVGDAAHIVPPTGAKGLNLAMSDVYYLSNAFRDYYQSNAVAGLEQYSNTALSRVWKASRFSWTLTKLLHDFYDADSPMVNKIRESEFEYLNSSKVAQASFAENYVGLPY